MTHFLRTFVLACAFAGGSAIAAAAPPAPGTFGIVRTPLPGEGRGDYLTVDTVGGRLYVTHATQVHILDLATLRPLAVVTGLTSAHGVALDGMGHGFVSDGNTNSVVMFDAVTGATMKTIPVGEKPDSILFDPASGRIMAFDGDSAQVSVIDPATATVVATIKLPYGPEFSQTDGKGAVWANMEESSAIAVIDSKTMKLDHTIALTGCEGPAPLAFDPVNRVLFSGCGNKVMAVTDADAGTVIATVPIGGDPDGIVFDPGSRRVIVANRDKTWTIVQQQDKSHYAVVRTLPIDEYAKTVALDPKTHRIFSSTADLIWPKPTPGKKLLPNAKPGSFRLVVVTPN